MGILVLLLIFASIVTVNAQEPSVAHSYRLPLEGNWSPVLQDFNRWNTEWKGCHLGQDIEREDADKQNYAVYPIADGIVKFADIVLGYTVIIEHKFPTVDPDQRYLCSVYYHMKRPGEGGIQLTVGDTVSINSPIGYVSGKWKDHKSVSHLHFGIRKGRYKGTVKDPRTGYWYYPGYTTLKKDGEVQNNRNDPIHQQILAEWIDIKTYKEAVKELKEEKSTLTQLEKQITQLQDQLANLEKQIQSLNEKLETLTLSIKERPEVMEEITEAKPVAPPSVPLKTFYYKDDFAEYSVKYPDWPISPHIEEFKKEIEEQEGKGTLIAKAREAQVLIGVFRIPPEAGGETTTEAIRRIIEEEGERKKGLSHILKGKYSFEFTETMYEGKLKNKIEAIIDKNGESFRSYATALSSSKIHVLSQTFHETTKDKYRVPPLTFVVTIDVIEDKWSDYQDIAEYVIDSMEVKVIEERQVVPSLPSETVKAFYKALNEGDIEQAEEYVSPNVNLEDFLLTGVITRTPRKYYREGWKFLADKIKKIEIKGEQKGKLFGADIIEIVIQVTLKPGVKEQAKAKEQEFIRTQPGYPFGTFGDEVRKKAAKYDFIAHYFSQKQTCGLETWNGKWKIVFIIKQEKQKAGKEEIITKDKSTGLDLITKTITRAFADMRTVSTALETYYIDDNDTYPDKLSDLVPMYIESIPKDPFNPPHTFRYYTLKNPKGVNIAWLLISNGPDGDADVTSPNFKYRITGLLGGPDGVYSGYGSRRWYNPNRETSDGDLGRGGP